MPRRSIWSALQRGALFDLPTDEAALLRHYTLSDDDIEQIRVRRGGHNRLGFALQLCAFRYPGRILVAGEAIPLNVLRLIAAQQGRGSSRAQERTPDRTPRRNPRPLERGLTLPHGRAQPARRHRHLLEYCPSRRSDQTAETRRPDGRARALAHVSPLGWAHILLAGEYRWPKRR